MRTVNFPGYEQSLRSEKVEQKEQASERENRLLRGNMTRVPRRITLAAGHTSAWQAISALARVFFCFVCCFFFLPDYP